MISGSLPPPDSGPHDNRCGCYDHHQRPKKEQLRHAAGLTRLNKLGSWKEVFLTLGIACVGIQLLTSSLLSQEVRRPNDRLMNAELLQRGQRVYMDHCSGCHGKDGDGQGPGAYGLNPKPRDLTSPIFKLRSTPAGTLPTDEDMIRTVKQGVVGTSMNAFDLMPDQDVLAVVQYIKTFSTDWLEADRYDDPIYIPPTPAWFRDPERRSEHAENGRDPFIGNCSTCHGEEGRGDGISATALMDAWEQPARPANLIEGKIKSGRTASDLYKAITTGLDGSPMPSFHGAIEDEELWDIVAYLVQLREDHRNQKTFQP